MEFLKYLKSFWHNFWTKNTSNSIKGSKNLYSSLAFKKNLSHNTGSLDQMINSSEYPQNIP